MSRKTLPFLALVIATLVACRTLFSPTPSRTQIPTFPQAQDRQSRFTPSLEVSPTPTEKPLSTPPRLTSRQPAVTLLDEREPEIELTFNRMMDRESVAAALSVEPAIPFTLHREGESLIVDLAQPFTVGASYRFTLLSAAADTGGVSLSRDYTWTYTTKATLARVTWPTFANRATPIAFHFNYAVDPASFSQALTLDPPHPGEFIWSRNATVATFKPAVPLPQQTQFTFAFSGPLYEPGGDELPPPDPLTFTTPPPILAVNPAENAITHPAVTVRITFDRPMDAATTQAAFQIAPETPGSFTWDETTLIFIPESGALLDNSEYTITIAETATGSSGERVLNSPFDWNFRTEAYQDVASFGEIGANAQVLDVNGRRAVQFVLIQEGTATVGFELHRLSLPQFLDRYSSGFRGLRGWEPTPPISTEGAELVKTWQDKFARSGFGAAQEVIIPEDVPPGLYIFNLTSGHVDDQLILVLTRNTLAVKQAEGQLIAWVSDINGRSVSGIEVSVYARDGQLLIQGETDEKGVFRTRVSRDPQPLIVVARQGNDYTVSGLSHEWQNSIGYWWGWWQPAPTARDFSAYIYTDRPIYRPGQTVFFKAMVRHDADAILTLPQEGTSVTLRVRDARDNVVQTFEMVTNPFGSVDGEFQLAEGAMLGDYIVEMDLDGESHRQTFKVQDYRKPDVQVTVSSDAAQYVVGDRIDVEVDTRYFSGEPIPNARLTINQFILGSPYYWVEPDDRTEYIWYQSRVDPIHTTTDENGRYSFRLNAAMSKEYDEFTDWYYSWGSNLQHTTWGVEVTVDDGSNQIVSGFTVFKVFSQSEEIHLDTSGYLKTPGQQFVLKAGVEDVMGQPVVARQLQVQLRRWNGEESGYTTVLQTAELRTDDSGEGAAPFTVEEPGYYQVYVTGSDSRGQPIRYISGVYVFSRALAYTNDRGGDLRISADRDSYTPGEAARLIIESSQSGPALLTFERGTTRHEQLVNLTAPMTVIDVTLRKDYAPNIFVTVNMWVEQDTHLPEYAASNLPDSRMQIASVELHVPVTDKDLSVVITPDHEVYAPRQEATFKIKITDSQSRGVRAEVSLAMVDEAIFSLSDDLSGPIFDAFYDERPHIVRTYNSMALYRELWAGGRGGGGDGEAQAGQPRSDFPDTAAWLPVTYTDERGEAEVTLTLPDSLTSWRLTAKATTADDTRVGETVTNILTQQPILVRPILPRTLTAGDRLSLFALVHNFGDEPRELEVTIQASGLALDDSTPQTISLAAGERQIVGWSASAVTAGEADLTIRARPEGGAGGDAIQLSIPVRPLAVPDFNTQLGDFSGTFETTIPWQENALPISTVQIELNRTIAGSLLTGLEYLTGFPYGCVEQTMSKALPNAVVGRAFHQLGVGNPTLQADLPPKINAGLQKLYGYQHNDGGWGWWYDDATHDYQTAWVVFGLAVTAEAGYEVDPGVIERGADWLSEHLGEMDIRTRAYALYSMAAAGHGDLVATQTLAQRLDELDTFSQFALALTLHELGESQRAGQIVDELVEAAEVGDGKVYWSSDLEDGHYRRKTMASSTRTTALGLSALVKIRPGHALESGVVRWLMSQRKLQGWGTTNETAYAIIGLTDHLLASEFATADTQYSVTLNGRTLARGDLNRGEPAVTLEIPASQLVSGDNQLVISQTGEGRLYYLINSRIYLAEPEIAPAGSVQVTRVYLDPDTGKRVTTVAPGDLVKVQLTVVLPDDGSYILLEDNLPGGLEALNESLNTTTHVPSAAEHEEPRYYWQEYGYNHKEVFGDHVTFFMTELSKGTHTYVYFARATHAGTFVAMPAEAYAMYDLSVWGRSGSERLSVIGGR